MTLRLVATGSYLPKKIVSNSDLAKSINTSDQWIVERTGITQRHISDESETCVFMAVNSAKIALESSRLSPEDIDLIIVASTTADSTFPSVASSVQVMLGCRDIPAFDIQAVCAGFIYALSVASALSNGYSYKNILIIGVERMSLILDWQDRNTCVLFGDGAGSAIFQQAVENVAILTDSIIHSNGAFGHILNTTGGIGYNCKPNFINMNGREVFRHGVQKMSTVASEILQKNSLSMDDIAYVVPHQANVRMIDSIAENLNISDSKIIKTIHKHANCSAASIPLALDYLFLNYAQPKSGDLILTIGFGAGLVWGANLISC